MKLDPKQLRAEADAHAERMASPLWSPSEGERDKSWLAPLTGIEPNGGREPRSRPEAQAVRLDASVLERQAHVDAVERTAQRLAEPASWHWIGADGIPNWLQEAAGNPHTYDAPDATRQAVCVRVLPGTYDRLRTMQRRTGLRTLAGAWELLLRLGLAVAERLPSRAQGPSAK